MSVFQRIKITKQKLIIQYSRLTTLNDYDLSNITKLVCSHNEIRMLPNLPASLKLLDCSFNKLISLPNLSHCIFLYEIDCSRNRLTDLPDLTDCTSLIDLNCSYNKLTTINVLIPETLQALLCSNNKLIKIDSLPESLTVLDCSHNDLDQLPQLPESLTVLNCSHNDFHHLPQLPLTLQDLDCRGNPNLILPALPANLDFLNDKGILFIRKTRIKQYNEKAIQFRLPTVTTEPSMEDYEYVMFFNEGDQSRRVLDLAIIFKNSGLPPYVVADIIDWDRNRDSYGPAISAFDVNQIVQHIEPIMNPTYLTADDTRIPRPSKPLTLKNSQIVSTKSYI